MSEPASPTSAPRVRVCALIGRDERILAFLFDVTLTESDRLDEPAPRPHRWASERELTALQPQAVRDALIAGTLSVEKPWRAWTP
jgi:8-oxo-dGTP diphosphatase